MHTRLAMFTALFFLMTLDARAQSAPMPPDPKTSIVVWDFAYTGFLDQSTGVFDPTAQLSGRFVAQDLNRDDVIDMAELVGFQVGGREYVSSSFCNTTRYLSCKVHSFSYGSGALAFDVQWWGNDEAVSGWGGRAVAGEGFNSYSYRLDQTWTTSYTWTPVTGFTISAIPEPQGALMLGVGLLGLAAWRRLRRLSLPDRPCRSPR